MFVINVSSLSGSSHRLEVARVKLAEIKVRLEADAVPFHEIRLFQGDRELVNDDSTVEVELQVVRSFSSPKALAALEKYCDFRHNSGIEDNCYYRKAVSAAAALGEMQDWDVDLSNHVIEILTLMTSSSHNLHPNNAELLSTLSAAFGRCCGDPAPYIPMLLEKLRPRRATRICWIWASQAILEIASRSEEHLKNHTAGIAQRAQECIQILILCGQLTGETSYFKSYGRVAWSSLFRLFGHFGNTAHEGVIENAVRRIEKERERSGAVQVPLLDELLGAALAALELIRSRDLEAAQADMEDVEVGRDGDLLTNDDLGADYLDDNGVDAPSNSNHGEADGERKIDAETDPLMEEQKDLQEALLKSKAEGPAPISYNDSVVILRLTRCCEEALHALRESSVLGLARKRVEDAGCNLFPEGARGACLLVPLTEEQLIELGLQLEKHHIVALRSDKPAICEALRTVPPEIRPKLRDDHRAAERKKAEFSDDQSMMQVHNSNGMQAIEAVRPLVQEIALLHPRIRELILQNVGISEPSEVISSAPCGEGNSSAQPWNPRHYGEGK